MEDKKQDYNEPLVIGDTGNFFGGIDYTLVKDYNSLRTELIRSRLALLCGCSSLPVSDDKPNSKTN